jgi:replicative DNA helicase
MNDPASNVVSLPGRQPERFPVASPEAEQGLLGAILNNPDLYALASGRLTPAHFSQPLHRAIWEAMTTVGEAGMTPTLITVRNALGRQKVGAELVPGMTAEQYVNRLSAEVASATVAREYLAEIRSYWALREIEAAATRASEGKGYVASQLLGQVLSKVDTVRAALIDRERHTGTIGAAASELLRSIEDDLKGETMALPTTGITKLDRELGGGLQPATLITLPGRTGMGKSIFGTEVAAQVAREGFATVYHSLEMSSRQVAARMVSSTLQRRGWRLDFSDILRRHGLTPRQAEMVAEGKHALADLPLLVEDGGGRTIADISASSDRAMNAFARRGFPVGLVVVDHAHIVKPGRNYQREDEALKEVADGALTLAKGLNCPVLLLAQCNRKTEGRDDKRPTLADIRGGGAFEENSDAVIFVYRAAYYLERSPAFRSGEDVAQVEHQRTRNDLELIIDKNRLGQSNQVIRTWIDIALNAIRDRSEG